MKRALAITIGLAAIGGAVAESPMDVMRCAKMDKQLPADLSADLHTLVGVHFRANKQAFDSACGNGPQVAPDVNWDVDACAGSKNHVGNNMTRNRPTITYDTIPGVNLYTVAVWDILNSFCHMLVFNVFLDGVDNTGYTMFPYTPPVNPFATSNGEPYVFVVYAQRNGMVQPDATDLNRWINAHDDLGGRFNFNMTATADKYELGPPIGINWVHVGPDEYGAALWQHDLNAFWIPEATRNMVTANLDPIKKTCAAL